MAILPSIYLPFEIHSEIKALAAKRRESMQKTSIAVVSLGLKELKKNGGKKTK